MATTTSSGGGPLQGINVLAKYDANGNHIFSKVIGGFTQAPHSDGPLRSDAAGNIFIRMTSYGELDLGMGPTDCIADYVSKFDPMGTLLWTRCAFADTFAILPDGSWVTAATLSRSVKIGDQNCGVLDVNLEGKDGALARYDSSGAWVSTSCAADPSYQFLGTVLPDPSGMFFMTAAFRSRLTLPDNSRVTEENGGWTSLIAKVDLPH